MVSNQTATEQSDLLLLTAAFYLSIGFASIFSNVIVIFLIWANKSLQTPCFRLIGGAAFGALTLAVFFFSMGVDRMGLLLGTIDINRTGLGCLLTIGTAALFALPFHSLMTCFVGVDRLISIMAPVIYRTFGERYVISIFAFCIFVAVTGEIVGFWTAVDGPLECEEFARALNPAFLGIFGTLNVVYCSCIVSVYAVMLICFYHKRKRYVEGTSDYNMFMKSQETIMPTVKLIMILYFLSGVLPEVLINICLKFDRFRWALTVMDIAHILKATSSLVEGVALTVCSTNFRRALKSAVCSCKINQTTATGSGTTSTSTPQPRRHRTLS